MDFFDLTQKTIYVKGGQTDGRIKVESEEISTVSRGDLLQDEAMEAMPRSNNSDPEAIETSDPPDPPHRPTYTKTKEFLPYYREKTTPKPNPALTITQYRQKILDTIDARQVTIITGSTGCGKTTQVPQYILDHHAAKGITCNIIVIQPRRVGVMSVAKRVCEEKNWPLGSLCGYKVGLINRTSSDTRLTYVTTGVFLQTLLYQKTVSNYTHIIFDEIHEREQIMDFSLLIIKRYLDTNSPDAKLILMSATAEVFKFSNFFSRRYRGKKIPATVINIKRRLPHNVKIFYLNDLELLGKIPIVHYSQPYVHSELMSLCIKLITQFDVLDCRSEKKESVLIFLPGMGDIDKMYNMIKDEVNSPCGESPKWHPIPVHSSVSADDQYKAFLPAPPGYRKIVIATNIAESSITIPDLSIVIDFCLTKVLMANPKTNITRLDVIWGSEANLTQRAGRVGRVEDGIVYRLIPATFMQKNIRAYNSPDMTRCLLEKTTLQTLMLGFGNPQTFLAGALDPPNGDGIKRSMIHLKEIGAINLKSTSNNSAESLTLLGRLMAIMPVDVQHTRLIVLGYIFGVFRESIIIAAGLTYRGLFADSLYRRMKLYKEKLYWANGSCSDGICILNAYETWKQHKTTGYFEKSSGNSEANWAKQHCLHLPTLHEVDKLVNELTDRFKNYGFEESEEVMWPDDRKEFIVKLVMAGACYPNYFSQVMISNNRLEEEAVETLSGRDPFKTAFFTHFPIGERLELYKDKIDKFMCECDEDYQITTNNHRKVFLEFPRDREPLGKDASTSFDPRIPGGISMGVYQACKLKLVSPYLEFKTLAPSEAAKRAKEIKEAKAKEEEQSEEDCVPPTMTFESYIPSHDKTSLHVKITHVVSPNEFWCISMEEAEIQLQNELNSHLEKIKTDLKSFCTPPKKGQICLVKSENGKMCRGQILLTNSDQISDSCETIEQGQNDQSVDQKNESGGETSSFSQEKKDEGFWCAHVFFIDTGETKLYDKPNIMKYSLDLYEATKHIPALAFECTLAKVRPSPYKHPNNKWITKAVDMFRKITRNARLSIDIFSTVGGVTSVFLYRLPPHDDGSELSINDYLTTRGFGIECRERWMSEKYNRIKNGESWLDDKDVWKSQQYNFGDFDVDLSTGEKPVKLGGPNNPLQMELVSYRSGTNGLLVGLNTGSVNAVLLNPFSQDRFSRLFVSASVFQPNNTIKLVLNETTLMPNIPGWAWIAPLLFAPVVEMRVSRDRRRFSGALCGLGLDENDAPVYPDNDSELVFDVDITEDDIVDINQIRFAASTMLVSQFYDVNMYSSVDRQYFKGIIKLCVENLLFKKRDVVISESVESGAYVWSDRKKFKPSSERLIKKFENLLVFPPIRAVKLVPENKNKSIADNLDFLHDLVTNRKDYQDPLFCELCKVACSTIDQLGVHFSTEGHINKEAELRDQLK